MRLIFVGQGYQQKLFNFEHFPIYGMLKNLPIISSRTSQKFYPLFFFIPIAPPIIPFLFYCVSDNITMQE